MIKAGIIILNWHRSLIEWWHLGTRDGSSKSAVIKCTILTVKNCRCLAHAYCKLKKGHGVNGSASQAVLPLRQWVERQGRDISHCMAMYKSAVVHTQVCEQVPIAVWWGNWPNCVVNGCQHHMNSTVLAYPTTSHQCQRAITVALACQRFQRTTSWSRLRLHEHNHKCRYKCSDQKNFPWCIPHYYWKVNSERLIVYNTKVVHY